MINMNSNDWLEKLGLLQKVIINSRDARSIGEVERFTKTMIVVKVGEATYRFNKTNGYSVGNDLWDIKSLSEATPKLLKEVKEENRKRYLINLFGKQRWNKVDLERLETIYSLLKGESNAS